jgi:hypothetical protein
MTNYTDKQREEALEALKMELEETADWRSRKAEEFPDDTRNADAAKTLAQLSSETTASAEALNKFLAFWENPDAPQTERQSMVMREIGFSRHPSDLDEVIKHITNSN